MTILDKKAAIIDFLQTYVQDKQVVLGLSGGIDSATVAFLAVAALGADKIHGFILPSSTNAEEDARLATEVATSLGVSYETVSIEPLLDAFKQALPEVTTQHAIGNLKARIRMSILYTKANSIGGIVLGTGNKTECMIGYYTKYGDGGVDLLPIANLYKHEVRALAKELGVPQEIIEKKPTAGLWEGQYDEDEIGMSYDVLDSMLDAIETKHDLSAFESEKVARVQHMIKISEHKRHMPPVATV
ncbi:MAG: NH(3)-dependent NAD(+) synthetase [Candidatus Magasanikbacteria bacterium GW2011_GWD2_43_18]|uniref:NH(3)-dependent NAD(+) synthetase n=1 Tax=Candidatus Magasanikbacteria bacterium GW2011_GWE2_42_7 TaxID=1619052 RepID=A0A0G1BBG2_9BACT|nr:MAG: NH(3)-dependent NAD(+) synthetase [Candidatus Magasanikbacteria bacterium GW2011_GWC2_42_27]KKS70554.1 MAG: NH(3)-dependent NAD(+) synthetase [Candidatus Magasanikbacteria bacterium GW2011_GWE2_42_7]KKT03837.1 MAG: NH(3)-dependent NAD(+) synthetase [Candidatus Magasanikbacteria bacterium GW2011_GWD2_43_18]KKT25508.1 MAG: NH(3)-dependent NAD(+) synthetase [Candidatus Magasanikbacteria bacterium GW2011_GWA2_43_9]HBB38450.1 NAD(+) synthetase [Candidatus Magasanikbacteria bacterium]